MATWNLDAEVANSGSLVAVTGVWNPVGVWIIRLLLEKGYKVRSALSSRPEHAVELMALKGAQENLQLTAADMLDYGDLTRAFHGCSSVFLTTPSSESLNGLPDYPAGYIEAEVRSNLNVVEACANTASVKRVVLTSCASTMVFGCDTGTKVVDENCWSNMDYCRKNKLWGAVSKTFAERAAWALAQDRGVDLVVINPATIVGPRSTSTTLHGTVSQLEGRGQAAVIAFAHVDIVADAHIRVLEKSDASGRFLVFNRLVSNNESLQLQKSCNYSSRIVESWRSLSLSNQKLQGLGVNV